MRHQLEDGSAVRFEERIDEARGEKIVTAIVAAPAAARTAEGKPLEAAHEILVLTKDGQRKERPAYARFKALYERGGDADVGVQAARGRAQNPGADRPAPGEGGDEGGAT